MWLMAVATCAGCFFKETVLVCAVLALFARHWKWEKRVLLFAGIVAVYVVGKKFLLGALSLNTAAFSMDNATNVAGLLRPRILMENFKLLFSPTLNHALFANAGTLVAVLVVGWRRRFLPYMAVIVVYLAGQLMYGGFVEFHIFMQILPLSLILLSEWWQDYAGSGAIPRLTADAGLAARKKAKGGSPTRYSPEASAPGWALRETFPVLMPLTLVLIGLSTGIAAWRYYIIFEDLQPAHRAQSEIGEHIFVKPEGHFRNLAVECESLRKKYTGAEMELARIASLNGKDLEAIGCYRNVLSQETNAIAANNLAWLLATASDPGLRNGNEAVRLAEQACQSTQYNEAPVMGILAAAYAEAGRFDDAVVTAQKARAMALAQGQNEFAAQEEHFLELYKSGRAYHREAKPAP
jgi:hypothetical protein